jgi:hypothetical protein
MNLLMAVLRQVSGSWNIAGRSFLLSFMLSLIFTSNAKAGAPQINVEVHTGLRWVITDGNGRHETFLNYPSFVCSPNKPCIIDCSEQNSFMNPATKKRQDIYDGVVFKLTIGVSGNQATFHGTIHYQTHLGITHLYEEKDGSLNGQTLRLFTTYVSGKRRFGSEFEIMAAENINDGVFVVLKFDPTTRKPSKFKNEPVKVDKRAKPEELAQQ